MQQPDDLDIAVAFGFEQPRGTKAMEIAVEIEFEQRGGIVRRAAGVGATGFGKAERVQIERSDEGIQETSDPT